MKIKSRLIPRMIWTFGLTTCATLLTLSSLVGCGNGDSSTDRKSTASAASTTVSEDPDPCTILSDALLSKHFNADPAEINRSPSKYSPHPLCIATWPKENAEELQKQYDAQYTEYLRKKILGEDVTRPEKPTNEVDLTVNKNRFDDNARAASAFASAMGILQDGKTFEVQGKEQVFEPRETELVTGVGDKAYWVPSMNQLSVLSGRSIFHVAVILGKDAETNLTKARELATSLTEVLN